VNFAALKEYYGDRKNCYRIVSENNGGRIIILAPHGGKIEPGTSEIVRAIAGNDLSYYLFEGCLPTKNQDLHITSTNFDEPECLALIKQFETCLAIHGCRGNAPKIYVGGSDSQMKEFLIAELRHKDYPAQIGTGNYKGGSRENISNRTVSGKGIQLELSTEFRHRLFFDWKNPTGRKNITELFTRFVSEIRELIR
jgi:phage replication-related protein YjqB (UPF0714/DUF867 family)